MNYATRLMLLGLIWVNGVTVGSADVVVDGQVIESADISAISIDPVSGDVNINAGGLYTVTKDSQPPAGPNVVINSLTASNSVVLVGQTVTISWTTTDADSCTPANGSGGWSGQAISLPNGVSSSLTLNTAGSFSFRLNCSNNTPSSTFRTVTVLVNEDVDPPPPSSCPQPTLNGATDSWSSFFGASWPDPTYRELLTAIPTAGYLALEFNTGNVVDDGGATTIQHTSTSADRLVSISECPGDFHDHLPDLSFVCSKLFQISGSIKWNTEPGYQAGQCNLEPNKTYYLNTTFTDGRTSSSNRCTGTSSCRTFLRVWH